MLDYFCLQNKRIQKFNKKKNFKPSIFPYHIEHLREWDEDVPSIGTAIKTMESEQI